MHARAQRARGFPHPTRGIGPRADARAITSLRAVALETPRFFGSSGSSGERISDLEEEVGVVAKAIGHSLDDLDLVVDALEQARV